MIKNIIFDLGRVIIDWNPHHLYDPYFGSAEKTDWFLQNICTGEWNTQLDSGVRFADGIKERIALFPEWEKEIRMYLDEWPKMINGLVPGTSDYVLELKNRGYKIFALSNWSDETFYYVRDFEFFKYLSGMVISGYEKVTKPSPEIFNLLMSRYDLKASECVFVDDSQINVDGALFVGMQSIRFENCEQLRAVLEALLES